MDSITQAALGASIGEAVLGRKVGRKAAVWGAVFGTLPDLDVLVDPFVSDVEALLAHRGPTHSLLFAFVVSPAIGWMLARLHRRSGVGTLGWMKLTFWALFTHPLLDACTGYGTQLFLPFTRYPVAFSTISIVDPLYTLPLLAGLTVAYVFRRRPRLRLRASVTGLVVSTMYLAATGVNKLSVDRIFLSAWHEVGPEARSMFSSPSLFNNLLWVGLVDDGERVWYGTYSMLDDDREIDFRPIDKNRAALAGIDDTRVKEVILWFTRGFYSAEVIAGDLVIQDWHVGRIDLWLTDRGDAIFRFRVLTDPDTGSVVGFETLNPSVADRTLWSTLRLLLRRMVGDESPIVTGHGSSRGQT